MSTLPSDLASAVLATVVYSDIFDQPLRPAELHRYLHGYRISDTGLAERLENGLLAEIPVERIDGHLVLSGRTETIGVRAERERMTGNLLPAAHRYGRLASAMPFVRMLALTGGLAVGNADESDDIDYFLVSEPGRVWTSRLFVLVLVKLAGLRGIVLCPNYFLSSDSLELEDRSIFTARELAQMVPLAGLEVYDRMREVNAWVDACLPNASGPPPGAGVRNGDSPRRIFPERLLGGQAGDGLERWEMRRKIRKFSNAGPATGETAFDAQRVQGHFESYRAHTLAEFDRRMKALL